MRKSMALEPNSSFMRLAAGVLGTLILSGCRSTPAPVASPISTTPGNTAGVELALSSFTPAMLHEWLANQSRSELIERLEDSGLGWSQRDQLIYIFIPASRALNDTIRDLDPDGLMRQVYIIEVLFDDNDSFALFKVSSMLNGP